MTEEKLNDLIPGLYLSQRQKIIKIIEEEKNKIILQKLPSKIANRKYNCGMEGCCNTNPKDEREKWDIGEQIGYNRCLEEIIKIIK